MLVSPSDFSPSSNSSQSTRPTEQVLWEELLILSRFPSYLRADEWNFCPLAWCQSFSNTNFACCNVNLHEKTLRVLKTSVHTSPLLFLDQFSVMNSAKCGNVTVIQFFL